MNAAYDKFRKPMPQTMSILTLLPIGMCMTAYSYGLTIEDTPIYLKISTIFMLICCALGLSVSFLKEPKTHKIMKRNAHFLFVINFLILFSFNFAFYNLYYFSVVPEVKYLFIYWIIGFSTNVLGYVALFIGCVLLYKTPKWIKGETDEEKSINKAIVIIVFFLISFIFAFYKFIECFILPHLSEVTSQFVALFFIQLISYGVTIMMYINYQDILENFEIKYSIF